MASLFDSDQSPGASGGQVADDATRWRNEVGGSPWARALIRAGAKIGPRNWVAWEGLLERRFAGKSSDLVDFLAEVPPEQRWPDRVEAEHRQQRPEAGQNGAIVL